MHIRSKVILKKPRPYGNIGEFDYTRYLKTKGITLTGYIKDFNEIEKIGSTSISKNQRFKAHASKILSNLARPEAEVLKAVLLGDKSCLTNSIRDRFACLGISHLMAISGLHIGLVIMFGYLISFNVLRCIPPIATRLDTPLVAKIIGLLSALLYAGLVGPYIPTIRATIMAMVVVGSLLLTRKNDITNSLAFSGIVILLIWPISIYSPSFLLSFVAVLGIIGIINKFNPKSRFLSLIIITIAATVFTLPMVLYIFGFVSPLGLISNLIFVPVFSLFVMPLGLTGLLVTFISDAMASYLFLLSMYGITLILKAGDLFGVLLPVKRPWLIWVYSCYFGLILAFFGKKTRARTILVTLSVILIVTLPIAQQQIRLGRPLTFDFISVGQGDATLITSRRHAILIDAGGSWSGFDTGRFIVAPHLLQRGITRLDLVVITHSHPDHIGGIPFILKRFNVDKVWTNMVSDWDPVFEDVTRITRSRSIPIKAVCLGDSINLGDITIEVLNPLKRIDRRKKGMNLNLYSIVLRIGNNDMKGLFMADAEGMAELSLSHLGRSISADVLKVAHHGAARSCQEVFLSKVKPSIAVISCGYKNRYHVPSPAVLQRLGGNNIKAFRTDMDGEIMIRCKEGILDVKLQSPYADIR
ncbi:MAG: DNA internalization-related competence protein ComEC/Rec2 [Deltaproteobacteria bacterium]|nr:DNA internalization-related competence protein ComEC/Rec2 [Deltaproteobacteria bacterium]